MRKTGLIVRISSQDRGSTTQNMQVLYQQSKAYFNFINSLKSESTRKSYTYYMEKFLGHYEKDLDQFLRLSQDEMTNSCHVINVVIPFQYMKHILIVR